MNSPASFSNRLDVLISSFGTTGELAGALARLVDRLNAAGVVSEGALFEVLMQSSTPVSVRLDACWLLPRMGLEGAQGALITLLRDDDPNVRAEAAASLGLLSNDTVVGALVACLAIDPDRQVRLAAIHALGILSHPKSAPHLQALVSNPEEDASVRADATEALAHVDANGVINVLLAALLDPAPAVRFSAAYALGEQGDPAALPGLRLVADNDVGRTEFGDVAARAAEAIDDINNRLR